MSTKVYFAKNWKNFLVTGRSCGSVSHMKIMRKRNQSKSSAVLSESKATVIGCGGDQVYRISETFPFIKNAFQHLDLILLRR